MTSKSAHHRVHHRVHHHHAHSGSKRMVGGSGKTQWGGKRRSHRVRHRRRRVHRGRGMIRGKILPGLQRLWHQVY